MEGRSHHFSFFLSYILLFFLITGNVFSQNLCEPGYSTGCSQGDGFTDFAVAEIQNYNSDCANLNGTGWSQYLSLGPALFIPGENYDFIMSSDYNNQNVSIWIDFNDDYNLSADEMILFDFSLGQAGQSYTAVITIPINAQQGLHYMRARTNWSGSCDDPCENYGYGEAEDYYVFIGEGNFGEISGIVTRLTGGTPIENAQVTLNGNFTDYESVTGANGTYLIENVLVGEYQVICSKTGFNEIVDSVTIEEEVLLNKNFDLTQPTIEISQQNLSITLSQNQVAQEYLNIINNGDGELNWSASVAIQSKANKDYLDLQFEYPTVGSNPQAGIESDGEFIYTTVWTGNQFLQYDFAGNLIESFSIPGVSGLRDLAYDGTYFYGSAGIPLVYEMDFQNKELVGTFNAPENVRAIAYDDNLDLFYSGNWSNQITIFDNNGTQLGSFNTGPTGNYYYGLAYDNASPGGPFLWGYGAANGSDNMIVQMQLPSGTETGFALDLETVLDPPIFNGAGGLYTHPNLIFGKWTLGGLVQNHSMWGLELGDAQTWLGISPNAGTLQPGESQELAVNFDASDLVAGVYNADILFNSWPDVGTPEVIVEMTVTDFTFFLCNLSTELNCTDVNLAWDMCPGGAPVPDSFNIYRNEDWIATAYEMNYTDSALFPDSNYTYKVSWFINGVESTATSADELYVAVPENLEPSNLNFTISGGDFVLHWDAPQGCLMPDSYNIYENGNLLVNTSEMSLIVSGIGQEYFVTAVYYFGESTPSNSILITGMNDYRSSTLQVFPNPAKDFLNLVSNAEIESLHLFNIDGKLCLTENPDDSSVLLDISNLDAGIYFIRIGLNSKVIQQKIIIK